MNFINVHAAKTNLSKLIERACRGEEIIIARGNVPVVRLVPVEGAIKPERIFGSLRGQFEIPDTFFDPLPVEELDAWDQ